MYQRRVIIWALLIGRENKKKWELLIGKKTYEILMGLNEKILLYHIIIRKMKMNYSLIFSNTIMSQLWLIDTYLTKLLQI